MVVARRSVWVSKDKCVKSNARLSTVDMLKDIIKELEKGKEKRKSESNLGFI